MSTPNYKTIEAFKMILQALGPHRFSVVQLEKKVWGTPDRNGHRKRTMARTHYGSFDGGQKKNLIEIYGEPTGYFDGMDTVLHELMHAAYPALTEDEILKLTSEISADLWQNF